MPERYVPVLFGSLVECQQCWAVVPRWRVGRHNSRHAAWDARLGEVERRLSVLAGEAPEHRPAREAVPL